MKLDPRITASDIHRILARDAAETFGPARTKLLYDRLGRTAEALALIAAQPMDLTDEPPDTSGLEGGDEA